jgi:TolB-like protein
LTYQLLREKDETIRVTFDFGQPQKNRIAVLFFHNLSGNAEDEYLSEGLTEDIITRLAKIEGLSVKSLTDVLSYRNRPATIREVGKALNVDAVLEGSVRKINQTLLVTAQLIDVSTGLHIWTERYERKIALEDIFGLQNELATKIAQAAHLNLTQSAKETLTKRPTTSVEAYEFYLKGKYYHLQMTTEGNWMAVEMFQKAIELDADFALAYADLGDAYANHYHMVEPPDKFWLDQAIEQIRKALTLDKDLPEAYKALGHCYEHLGQPEKAVEEYKKALVFRPNYVDAQIGLGQSYCSLGQYEEALTQLKTALEHHPEISYIYYTIGCVYSMQGDKDQALEWIQKAFDRGFRNIAFMKKDPFLDPIRKDPRFVRLLKDLSKKAKNE